SRVSPNSLFSPELATFEEGGDYDHKDATGFIRLNSLRLRQYAAVRRRAAERTAGRT
ncbi:MAG: argininosuccinate synthase, partial [Desulfovibrio sp.]|nr:argininosuccinate synthase [Desulfovibrio sp.]